MKKTILFILTLLTSLSTMGQTQLFRGKSSYSSDILYTVKNGYVYRGKSNYTSDILYSVNGVLPIPMLIMMMQ